MPKQPSGSRDYAPLHQRPVPVRERRKVKNEAAELKMNIFKYSTMSPMPLNIAGVGARYSLTDRYMAETRTQFDEDIIVAGLRMQRYFNPNAKRFLFFSGLEGDFVSYKGDKSKGIGFIGEFLFGAEYFFTKRFSFQMDFGPAYTYLKDKETSEAIKEVDFVIDFGVTYYFGKGGK